MKNENKKKKERVETEMGGDKLCGFFLSVGFWRLRDGEQVNPTRHKMWVGPGSGGMNDGGRNR